MYFSLFLVLKVVPGTNFALLFADFQDKLYVFPDTFAASATFKLVI